MTTDKDSVSVEQVDREACRRAQVGLLIGGFQGDADAWRKAEAAFARHRIEATRQLEADKAEAFGLLEAAYEASSPYIVHNVGIGEVRDEIEDFLAKHRRPA